MSANINSKLIKIYSKRADITQSLEPMEGSGESSAPMTPEEFANQAMGIRTPADAAFSSPEAIRQRMLQRSLTPDYRQRAVDIANQAMGIRTPADADFSSPEAIRQRMLQRAIVDGIPVLNPTDQSRAGASDAINELRKSLAQQANALFDADGPAAANNAAEDARDAENAAALAANDAATTMGVRFPFNQNQLAANARNMLDDAAVNAQIDDEAAAAQNSGMDVRFVPKWQSELRALLEEEKQRAAQIDEANARAGDDAVREFREGQQSAAKARAEDNAKPSYLAGLLNPTGNQMADYGIYGGAGALLGGGLAAALSKKENRLRNALLFALLGGGLGIGGKYLADRYQTA